MPQPVATSLIWNPADLSGKRVQKEKAKELLCAPASSEADSVLRFLSFGEGGVVVGSTPGTGTQLGPLQDLQNGRWHSVGPRC